VRMAYMDVAPQATPNGHTVMIFHGNNFAGFYFGNIIEALRKEGFPEEEIAAGIQLFGPRGCPACTDGYKGRLGIYQVMPVTEDIGRIIMTGGNAIDIADQARKDGVWDLRRAGLAKAASGLTSLEEINSVTIE